MSSTLQPLQAICVAGTVEDCLDRLRVLQSLTPNLITQRDELSNILGETVAHIIQEQKKCEERYEVLVKRRSELKSLSNKTRYKKNQEKIEAQARELQRLTKELCTRLRESPNVSENLLKIQSERSTLITLFETFEQELMNKHSFEHIANWTAGRTSKYQKMMQVMNTDKEMQEQIKTLDNKIKKQESDMAHRIEELDIAIKESKDQLQEIQAQVDEIKANKDDERQARLAAQANMNELTQSKLTKQVFAAKLQLQTEKHVHNVSLSYFERRRAKINGLLKEWTEKYETEVTREKKKLDGYNKRIATARTGYTELKPEKEEAERLMHLEIARAEKRAQQTEKRTQQVDIMNKIKILYMLHARVRGPLPKLRKGKKGKK